MLLVVVVVRRSRAIDVVLEEEADVEDDGDEDGGLQVPDRRPLPGLPGLGFPARPVGGPECGKVRATRPSAVAVGRRLRLLLPTTRRGPGHRAAVGGEEARRRHHGAGALEAACLHRRAKML